MVPGFGISVIKDPVARSLRTGSMARGTTEKPKPGTEALVRASKWRRDVGDHCVCVTYRG